MQHNANKMQNNATNVTKKHANKCKHMQTLLKSHQHHPTTKKRTRTPNSSDEEPPSKVSRKLRKKSDDEPAPKVQRNLSTVSSDDEGSVDIKTYRYGDSPTEQAHWNDLDAQIKLLRATAPGLFRGQYEEEL